jgi:hypothetical protein
MKSRGLILIAALAGGPLAAESPLAGTWQGKLDGVPAVTLTVKEEGRGWSGTIVFYKIVDEGSGPQVAGKDTSVLVDPKLEGKSLSFQVKHPNDALIGFRFELTGNGEGELKGKTTQTGGGGPPPIKMTKDR